MALEPQPPAVIIVALAVALGALVQTAIGFGMAIVAVPFLLLVDPSLVPGSLTVAMFPLTALMAWRGRADADLRGLIWGFVGRLPATVAAVVVLVHLSGPLLNMLMAATVLIAVLLSASGAVVRPARTSLLIAGAASGFMGTLTSIGGPPMALLYQHETGPRIRATLALYFTAGGLMSITALLLAGELDQGRFEAGLWLVVPTTVGYLTGLPVARRLDGGPGIRRAVLVVSAAAAVVAVGRELLRLVSG